MTEAGFLEAVRCAEALEFLAARRLADGGFPAEEKYYRVTEPHSPGATHSLVNWGGTSAHQMNPFVTVHALHVLKHVYQFSAGG